jgi:uracil-DNA glycosylase
LSKTVQLPDDWYEVLEGHFQTPSFQAITSHVKSALKSGKTVYPPGKEIFNAFHLTPLNEVRAVILGQDPYHGPGEAHGLCFSVKPPSRIPPSLRNIFKEYQSDLGHAIPDTGDLSSWAKSGVLLLNTILTVEHKSPASHKGLGWEEFTDLVIRQVSENRPHVAFILWGKFAQSKAPLINSDKHLILRAPHPAAEVYAGGKAGFFGSRPFSKTNDFLTSHDQPAIDWKL